MNSVPATGMPAAAIERAAAIAAGAGTRSACDCLTVRWIFWRGEEHLPKRESRDAGEGKQQHAKMQPTGRVHMGLLPRLKRQIHTRERT